MSLSPSTQIADSRVEDIGASLAAIGMSNLPPHIFPEAHMLRRFQQTIEQVSKTMGRENVFIFPPFVRLFLVFPGGTVEIKATK